MAVTDSTAPESANTNSEEKNTLEGAGKTESEETGTTDDAGKTEAQERNTSAGDGKADSQKASTEPDGGKAIRRKSHTSAADTWTVRGVDVETRRAAKMAAKREGKFLGDWLNETIRTAAHATLKGGRPPARQEDVTDVLQRMLDERLAPLAARVEELAAGQQRDPWWRRLWGR